MLRLFAGSAHVYRCSGPEDGVLSVTTEPPSRPAVRSAAGKSLGLWPRQAPVRIEIYHPEAREKPLMKAGKQDYLYWIKSLFSL